MRHSRIPPYLCPTKNQKQRNMKKIATLLFTGILAVTLYSCTQMNAKKYNDTVTTLYKNYTDKLTADIEGILNDNTPKEASDAIVKRMEASTDSCIGVMNGLKPMDEAKQFHEKVVAVFNGVKSEFIPEAKKAIALKGSENIEAYNKLVEEINATQTKLEKLEDDAIKAQAEFANKVGSKLEN